MEKKKNRICLLDLIPGVGNYRHGEKLGKSVLTFVVFFAFLIQFYFLGVNNFKKLITLGSVPGKDHSLFFLIEGSFQIILTLLFGLLYIYNIIRVKKMKEQKGISEQSQTFIASIIIPSFTVMLMVIVFPILVTILISFTNYDFKHIPPMNLFNWVGLKNYASIFVTSDFKKTFLSVFSWTLIWTFLASTLQIVIGVLTALILNQKSIKFKRFFGVIFLLPWAIPAFINLMGLSNMFNDSMGAINLQVLPFFSKILNVKSQSVFWKTDPFWSKVAIILIQGWIGFPYIYVLTTGILQSIPKELYEAAKIDGATTMQEFRHITLPSILMIAAPTFVLQYTGNFNNFSTIYLFNQGGPGSLGSGAGNTDILISWIYKLTTSGTPQYSLASAVTLIMSSLTIFVTFIIFKKGDMFSFEEDY